MPHSESSRCKSVTKFMTGAFAALAIGISGTASAQDESKPSPLKFPTGYGDMTFPAQYPDGTTISITQWSHFVPSYDEWVDQYAQKWGDAHNVKVTINHISLGDIPSTLSASIAAGQGPTLIEMNAAPASFIEGLQPLNDINAAAQATFGDQAKTCRYTSYLPAKDEWYGFCHGWVVDPGVYRTDLWSDAGYPDGPQTYDDLLKGGTKILQDKGIPVAVGLSPELDSEFFARALIWSFGGTIQDENGNVTIDSPQTLAAVEYIKKLFNNALTPEVFAWNPASNNQAYIAGTASYIQNSISFFRSAQDIGKSVTQKTSFRPGLKGPDGEVHMPAHIWFTHVMPKYVTDPDEIQSAKNFMLDLENNYSHATYNSKLYNFPAFSKQVPQLYTDGGWLDNDPWGSEPADKMAFMKTAEDWTVWPGYPGYANPAIGEIYQTHIISTMMANAANGKVSPKQAVEDATDQINKIFKKWRARGFVGGGTK